MRLIDADGVLKNWGQTFFAMGGDRLGANGEEIMFYLNGLIREIKNAPTVEPCYQTISCLDCKNYDKANYYCPRFCEVIREIAKENQRPQGKWIMDNEHTKNPLLWYKCNLCGVYHSPTNFCPNCGARMGVTDENG